MDKLHMKAIFPNLIPQLALVNFWYIKIFIPSIKNCVALLITKLDVNMFYILAIENMVAVVW